jgi:hypothetical protein
LGINPGKEPLDVNEHPAAEPYYSTLESITVPMKEQPPHRARGEGGMFLAELIDSSELGETALTKE